LPLKTWLIRLEDVLKQGVHTLREVIYGMTIYDWIRELEKARHEQERLFTLIVYGDIIGLPILPPYYTLGLPILPPYYTLRLLPYLVPSLETWRRSILRERDLTDLIDQEVG